MTKFSQDIFIQPTIPRFDGVYEHWSMLMDKFFQSKEYWGLMENGIMIAPPDTTQE